MSAGAFASVVLLDEWLAVYVPALPARLALILGFALGAGHIWTRYQTKAALSPHASTEAETVTDLRSTDAQILAEITTALEHLRSVGLLLEISEAHRQPLPRAVPLNGQLVIKHLDKARQRFNERFNADAPTPNACALTAAIQFHYRRRRAFSGSRGRIGPV